MTKMFMTLFDIKHLCMAIYFTSNSSKLSLRNDTAYLIFSAIPDPFICSANSFGFKNNILIYIIFMQYIYVTIFINKYS